MESNQTSIADLSEDQKKIIYAIEDGYSVFVTGSAGTGKSHLLRYLKENYLDSGLHITASTGIAAVNVGDKPYILGLVLAWLTSLLKIF